MPRLQEQQELLGRWAEVDFSEGVQPEEDLDWRRVEDHLGTWAGDCCQRDQKSSSEALPYPY